MLSQLSDSEVGTKPIDLRKAFQKENPRSEGNADENT